MTNAKVRTPWHYWTICAVWVAWNGLAVMDYVLSVTQGAAYFRESGMSDAQVRYFSGLPLWATAAWTVSVWAAALSAVLLVVKKSVAVWPLRAAILGTLGYCLYVYALSDGVSAMGGMWFMPAVVTGFMIALDVYIQKMRRAGITG